MRCYQACEFLQSKRGKYKYPSAYLVPSLFRHPGALPFQPIKPSGLKERLKQWLPTRRQAIAVSALLLLSLLFPVQNLLLDSRLGMQAVYRDLTKQLPSKAPPVLLVQVDQDSLDARKISARKRNPIDRRYLASLVNQLQTLEPKVVGIDYFLDSPEEDPNEDSVLAESVRNVVDQNTWLVFATEADAVKGEVGVTPAVADLQGSMQGHTDFWPWYVELLPSNANCSNVCPFAYVLALAQALNREPVSPDLPQPRLQKADLHNQMIAYLNRGDQQDDTIAFLQRSRLDSISSFAHWLQPILDFSIPPDQAYDSIPAWQLDGSLDTTPPLLQEQVVIIAPAGYDQAEDNFHVPMAVAYWRERRSLGANTPEIFTGGEAHAYTVHHLLRQHLIVPVPDFWMIGVSALLGKGITLILVNSQHQRRWAIALVAATVVYGLVSLQAYVSASVALPWLLSSAAFWVYILPALRKSYA